MSWTLICGAAKGVGEKIAYEFAKKKQAVVIQYRSNKKLAETVAKNCRDLGGEVELLEGDFSTKIGTDCFIKKYQIRFERTKNFVYNVGNYLLGNLSHTNPDQWYSLFETNLHAPYLLLRTLLPSIKKECGAIVTIGVSGLGRSRADICSSAYTITKEALWSMTLSLAKEVAQNQVRVNMVSPGVIEGSERSAGNVILPMKRPVTQEEVASFVVWLTGKEASYITGQNIEIAGGVRLS